MLAFIILFVLIIYVSLIAYVKLYYNFWSSQPVFHYYNLTYWFFSHGIINPNQPLVNKFCNFKNISVRPMDSVKNVDKQLCVNFLKNYYLRNNITNYLPTIESFEPYFIGHSFQSFLSMYQEPKVIFDHDKQLSVNSQELISIMTTRPLNVILHTEKFMVYYVDYLCVHTDHRKKSIAPQIIQTHEWHQRRNCKNILVSLFKREWHLTGIIPLTVYDTKIFRKIAVAPLSSFLTVIKIEQHSFHFYIEFLKMQSHKFDCFIMPDIANQLELIKTNNLFIYALKNKMDIIAVYLFRNPCTVYNNRQTIECFASISDCPNDRLFFEGFGQAYKYMSKILKTVYLLIENISHNHKILSNIQDDYLFKSPTAFFFYNYASKSIPSGKTFICY